MATEYTEHKYAEVLRAIADGKPVQGKWISEIDWWDFEPSRHSFHLGEDRLQWRVKPKPKVKKWRWVVCHTNNTSQEFCVTDRHYADEQEFHQQSPMHIGWEFLQKVEATMIEVDD